MVQVFGDKAELCEKFLNYACKGSSATIFIERGTPQTSGDTEQIEVQYETLLDLSHELVHVVQILQGRLSNSHFEKYRGVPYGELPWELEAYALEGLVYNKVFAQVAERF